MMKPDLPHLEALEALLAEKRKHEGYLAKLEERRDGTPERIFARLRDEYLTKVMDAQVRAHAEAETLASGLEVDQAAGAEVEARLVALEEQRVEGELREAVGELDSQTWQQRLVALNAEIEVATKERESLTSSSTRVRALLAEARSEPAMPTAASVPEAVPVVPPPLRTRGPAAPITEPPPWLEPTRPPKPALASALTAEPITPSTASESEDVEDADVPSSLGRPTGASASVLKTLQCGECGSMNYPPLWFCAGGGGVLGARSECTHRGKKAPRS